MNLSTNSLPINSNDNLRPLLPVERAKKLNRLLLDLAKSEEFKTFSPDLRRAVDTIREKFIGYNRETTKRKILKLLAEFFLLELDDLIDETRIDETEIKAALQDLIGEEKIREGKRRRWNELGEHYNLTYELIK